MSNGLYESSMDGLPTDHKKCNKMFNLFIEDVSGNNCFESN
uniref:Uncharacterized protein n=1 Tax=Lepeophtheirus salmonis TaxID=72036 RepID=A0A0K2UMA5_LEPSM